MDPPPTRYLEREGGALAYQVVGEGPHDVIFMFEVMQHLDLLWTDPHIHQNLAHAAAYSRTVYFQRRGFGLSDPLPFVPSIEQQADDAIALMDELGTTRATVVGVFTTCGVAALVAARQPQRVKALVLIVPFAQALDGSNVPEGWTADTADNFFQLIDHAFRHWGSGGIAPAWDSVLGRTPYNRRFMGMLERCSGSPSTVLAHYEQWRETDLTDIFSAVRVPTRVVRPRSTVIPEEVCRHVAGLIPESVYVDLPATEPGASVGEAFEPCMLQVEVAATGADRPSTADRVLATVLFTDLVGSTELLSSVGDARYRDLRAAHERHVHLAVEEAGGRLAKVLGDGTLSTFDSPSRAIECADRIRRSADDLGIGVRAGLHTGEIERAGPDVHGLAVHIAARVAGVAGAGEIVVSRTVKELVAGAGLRFASRGEHDLKGVADRWHLFTLTAADDESGQLPAEQPRVTVGDRLAVASARRAPATLRGAMRVGNAIQRVRARSGR